MDLPSDPPNGPAKVDFGITGKGTPSSFTINVSSGELFGNTFSGGTGALPFGVSRYGLWYLDSYRLPQASTRPRLFLPDRRVKGSHLYPASDYNPMGVCGPLAEPK